MPAGRPKITLEDLPENWKEEMLRLGEQGKTENQIRISALGGIAKDTYYRLMEDHPEFLAAVKEARTLSMAWWENLGQEMAFGNIQGNPTCWIFNMKNRAGWRDKTEVSGDPDRPVQVNANIQVQFVDAPPSTDIK